MKKYFTRKRLQWKLLQQSCKPTDCNFTKNGALVRPLWKSTESSNVIGGKPLWWRLEFTPPFNFKRALPQRFYYMGSAGWAFLKFLKTFYEISLQFIF